MKSHLLYLATAASTAHSWADIDTATLNFWSSPWDCTQAIYDKEQTCRRSEPAGDVNVVLDNTGSVCYSNPMANPPSGGDSWFSWLGPGPSGSDGEWFAYGLFVPGGQPVPVCDERGVCDPCDALDPVRGSDPAGWFQRVDSWMGGNETLLELGYVGFKGGSSGSGCGTWAFLPANYWKNPGPTNFCFPFQGNITVEEGIRYSCAHQGITSAEKCGAKCDKEKNLGRAVFANQENGEPACCFCYSNYPPGGSVEVCGDVDAKSTNPYCTSTSGEDGIHAGAFAFSVGVAALSTLLLW